MLVVNCHWFCRVTRAEELGEDEEFEMIGLTEAIKAAKGRDPKPDE